MHELTIDVNYTSIGTGTMENQQTPTLASPPDSRSPPTGSSKHSKMAVSGGARAGSEPVDAGALSKALKDFEDGGRVQNRTPGASPSRKRQRIYGDRFIPNREGQDLQASYSLLHDDGSPATPSKTKKRTPHGELHFQKSERIPCCTEFHLPIDI